MAEKKRSRKKLVALIIAAVLVIITAGSMVASRNREKPVTVTTDQALQKTITQIVTASGRIQPEIEVKIAPEVSGEIIEIPVREGQVVRRGELLLRIKPDSYRAQVESQEAALRAARAASVRNRAELAKAEFDYNRSKSLFDRGLISDSERNSAQTTFEIARAALQASLFEIERSEGALKQIRDALSKTIIYAPAHGTVSSLTSRVGERVVGTIQFAGTEVMRIADLDNMEARVNVNENDVVNVKVGDRAKIRVDAYPDRDIVGEVREIASTAMTKNAGTQEEVTNFEVKIRISDKSVRLRPGMSATADIETETVENAIAVPIQSVTVRAVDSDLSPEELEKRKKAQEAREKSDNLADVRNEQLEKRKERAEREKLQRVVFVKVGDTVKMQKVETGIADTTHMEIKSGVKAGDEIVSGSYTAISRRLKDGMRVEIEKPGKG